MAHAKCLTKMRLMKGLFIEVWLVLKEPRRNAGQLLPRVGIKRAGGGGLRGAVWLDLWPQTLKTTARQGGGLHKTFFLFCVLVPPIGSNQLEASGQRGLHDGNNRGHAPGTEQGSGG